MRGFDAISAPIKVSRFESDRFKSLFNTERSTFKSGAEQSCSEEETASKVAFLARTEALSGGLSALFHYPVQCEHYLIQY